jgi:hypothetical protein
MHDWRNRPVPGGSSLLLDDDFAEVLACGSSAQWCSS